MGKGFLKWGGLIALDAAGQTIQGMQENIRAEAMRSEYQEGQRTLKRLAEQLIEAQNNEQQQLIAARDNEEEQSSTNLIIWIGISVMVILNFMMMGCYIFKRCFVKTMKDVVNEAL